MGDLTTFTFPGRKTTHGCRHMAVWLPLFSELCRLEGLVRSHLDVTQVAGDYEKSGGTHREGTAADVEQDAVRVSELAREAGAPASWPRGESYGQPSMRRHSHLALDCSCPSGADYQITAVKAGYNGLGTGGRGGKDYIRRPSVWRNYTTGVAWMRARIAQLQQEEEDMPLTQTDATLVARTVITELLATRINASGTTVGVALEAAARAASLPTATDTTDALLGKWLGASGPTVAVALQDSYHRSARQEAKVAALVDLLESAGGGLDGAALERIADQAAEKAVRELGERLAGERPTEG